MLNRQIGIAGLILLKDMKNVLPLNTSIYRHFSVYGSAASRQSEDVNLHGIVGIDGVSYQGGGSRAVCSTYFLDPLTTLMTKARDFHFQIQYIIDQDDYVVVNRSLTN